MSEQKICPICGDEIKFKNFTFIKQEGKNICTKCAKLKIKQQNKNTTLNSNENIIQDLGKRGESALKNNLNKGESVIIKIKGAFGEGLILTNKHIIILKWGFMTGNTLGYQANAFTHSQVTSVEFRKGLLTGAVEILTPSNQNQQKTSYWGDNQKKDNVVTFNENLPLVEKIVRIIREKINPETNNKKNDENYLQDLEKLAELKDKGIISKKEFELKKKQILKI